VLAHFCQSTDPRHAKRYFGGAFRSGGEDGASKSDGEIRILSSSTRSASLFGTVSLLATL
jgi:hypothetical protein